MTFHVPDNSQIATTVIAAATMTNRLSRCRWTEGTFKTFTPVPNLCKSTSSSRADWYRRLGSLSKHLRMTVSSSLEMRGFSALGVIVGWWKSPQ
jgi:hypothetical protein